MMCRLCALLFLLASSACLRAAPPEPAAWQSLAGLAGTWKIAEPATPGQEAFRVRYQLISNDTTLVETYGDPAKRITQTMFHRDGSHVLATHYCAQGNQPRLRLRESDRDALVFDFLDATNLASPDDSHLTRLSLERDGERLVRREVYSSKGGDEADTLTLVRVD